jgi:PAS domain S-box-containing protein
MPFALPVGRVSRARQRLRDEHNLLDVLLDSVEVAMVACAVDGRLTHVNRRTRELLGRECAAGMDVAAWIGRLMPRTPSGLPLVLEDLPLMRALEGEVVRGVDVLLRSAVGDVLLSTSASPVNDERGRRRGAVAVFEDVTEQRAAEVQIRTELRHMGVALEVEDAIDGGRLLLHAQPIVATRFAERLEAIGCHFALDDFGTGYAALTYLKHLPIRYLKIDMDFVRDLVENPRSRAVVSGIVALAAGFGQSTIAEGVEDAATLRLLGELGVDLAQGYHLGRPGPIVALADADADADAAAARAFALGLALPSPPTLP